MLLNADATGLVIAIIVLTIITTGVVYGLCKIHRYRATYPSTVTQRPRPSPPRVIESPQPPPPPSTEIIKPPPYSEPAPPPLYEEAVSQQPPPWSHEPPPPYTTRVRELVCSEVTSEDADTEIHLG